MVLFPEIHSHQKQLIRVSAGYVTLRLEDPARVGELTQKL